MSERSKLARRLVFAVPAGLLATLLVFAAMEYLATMGKPSSSDLDRYVKARRIRESEERERPDPNGRMIFYDGSGVPYEEEIWIVVNGPGSWPPPPAFYPPFPSNTDRQPIPHDDDALHTLLSEPDRPRNANWILLKGAKPEYPREALAQGKAGYAVLEFVINEEGRTGSIRIIEQSSPEFGRAARQTVRNWLFIPRRENGMPVASETVRLRIEFRMKDS